MPELPEVETIARDLNKTVLLKTIKSVVVHDPFIVKGLKPVDFIKELQGQKITQVFRRGKALVLVLSSARNFVIQPMMTGQAVYFYPDEKAARLKETRVEILFSDGGILLYNDQRRFGHIRVVDELMTIKYFQVLGPEPLTDNFDEVYLAKRLRTIDRPIKNVLLDHTVVAGIGNIYASEILFQAKIKPTRKAKMIKALEIPLLLAHTKKILNLAITHRGSSMRNYRDGRGEKGTFNTLIKVYSKDGEPCPKCAHPIQRIMQAGRSSFYCKICQT